MRLSFASALWKLLTIIFILLLGKGVVASAIGSCDLEQIEKARAQLLQTVERRGSQEQTSLTQLPLGSKEGIEARARALKDQHLDFVGRSPEENARWIKAYEEGRTGTIWANGREQLFMTTENGELKLLNDTLGDKDLVTAMTNLHKKILNRHMQEYMDTNPAFASQLTRREQYSGFKDVQDFFEAGKIPESVRRDLAKIFDEANGEFAGTIKELGILRKSDDPATWFRSGIGGTVDEANIAAREARQYSGNKTLDFNDPKVQENLDMTLKYTETYRRDLEVKFGNSKLMEKISDSKGDGIKIFNRDVFEAIRKSKSDEDLAKQLTLLGGPNGPKVSATEAATIRMYERLVDSFSPAVFTAKREIINLREAKFGGISIDFKGLGATNAHELAAQMVGASNVSEALRFARAGEVRVTEGFNRDKQFLQDFFKEKGMTMKCSGDDCIAVFNRPMGVKERQKILQELAERGDPAKYRVASISGKVADGSMRTQLAVHGEGLEKALYTTLKEKLGPERVKGSIFNIHMNGRTLFDGEVFLNIASSKGKALTKDEVSTVNRTFRETLEKFNSELSADRIRSAEREAAKNGRVLTASEREALISNYQFGN